MTGWALLLAAVAVAAPPLTPAAEQGRRVAERGCAMCHAIGQEARSPNGGAPPFRALGLRYGNAISLERALHRIAKQGHLEMARQPIFESDAPALAAYIESLEPR
jgi:mono/diheme cytochrome c family protein